MVDNLVIVESPAKAKTIEKFLGKDFLVKSSFGHIRDLSKKNLGVNMEKDFEPDYIVSDDKKKVVSELKKLAKEAKFVWLASDEDREGEAIAWHLYEELKLTTDKTKRIVFHEITKEAILKAIESPRAIDENLVNAQQARRILDRLVGFELSPVLWKKVKPSLSAGRVQSVSVRLLVDREREVMAFTPKQNYRVTALFLIDGKKELKAELNKRFDTKEEAYAFLESCKSGDFAVTSVDKKPSKKSPAAPFTTSTLQQEASRKLGFSVAQTMTVAQKLYEAGKITYMRTDSVNLSDLALNTAKTEITEEYGEEYLKIRKYKTKAKGAQEAHEAIRPTYLNKHTVGGTAQEKRLYDLIWKRTIASQMADAKLEKTTVTIDISGVSEKFVATGEVIKFEGFLKVYLESTDDEQEETTKGMLPPISEATNLTLSFAEAVQRFSQKPPRYTEASLVKKLEELGIGRPSTYAPTISTIQQRGYVIKEDRDGVERKYDYLRLENNEITEKINTEITGTEKSKLFPNNIGMVVNDFLVEYFQDIMNFNFTAKVEKEFDDIAEGKIVWNKMIAKFYKPFHKTVEDTIETSDFAKGERLLGNDPETGKPVIVRIGRFGPIAQIGEASEEEKPRFASLISGQLIESITLEEALELFDLPRTVGEYEEKTVTVAIGRFGPYVRHDNKFVSLKKNIDDPYTINLERSIELIEEKREKDRNRVITIFKEDETMQLLNGRWGAYLAHGKTNYKLPKEHKEAPEKLTYEDCLEIIKNAGDVTPKSKPKAKAKPKAKKEKE